MLKIWTTAMLLSTVGAANVSADPAGDLLDRVAALDKNTFEAYEGYLFQSWLQFDENDLSYVLYVTSRKIVWLLLEQIGLERVAILHRLQGRPAAQG